MHYDGKYTEMVINPITSEIRELKEMKPDIKSDVSFFVRTLQAKFLTIVNKNNYCKKTIFFSLFDCFLFGSDVTGK